MESNFKKINHFAENLSYESGGLRTVVSNLDTYLNSNCRFTSIAICNEKEKFDNYIEFKSKIFKKWYYSNELKKYVFDNIKSNEILHLHGVFMHTQYISSKFCQKKQIPYVISPQGMLEPWLLKDKWLKKKIYFELILKNILSKSNIIHATTGIEKDNLFKLTKHKNIVEIPNLMHHSIIPKNLEYNPNEEYLLFLSRIHPKKGLDILIEAMAKIENKKIKLKVVGTKNEYSIKLKLRCEQLNIVDRVEFVGGVFGDGKFKLFANAKAFIAPAYSEAVGMVNLEAAVCKTPVITSYTTGISPEWNNNGGIMINPNVTELVKAINTITSCNDAERNQRGNLLSEFVIKNYSWEEKGYLWDELYNSLE